MAIRAGMHAGEQQAAGGLADIAEAPRQKRQILLGQRLDDSLFPLDGINGTSR